MTEWFCNNCYRVFESRMGKCCGEVEEFSLEKHGRKLIGLSNSWIAIWEKWKNHPKLIEVSNELANEGCYGAASCINVFIEELLGYNY